ncbi:hypothetical protein TcCL_NonESM07788 [Trypanosoma cruzi]|uniref:Uncharacterized protein n=2 Tax=Trypanosoma cruzi TaxID=5693 RepID=Q4CWJ8_TRYCC|nr:hypothetical protein, conserved [Trypanosoma cruzi]EAN84650.1 hypothetical protein, conserved [Trypanosoma cruzi]RNC42558.1 hypothetical protein TcCL_NonESM07788 [Trypanosoma cruzi]|eukprot:XP_806501.1 hypothetical protein [Trypanosoma cruzi strain CL Brener]
MIAPLRLGKSRVVYILFLFLLEVAVGSSMINLEKLNTGITRLVSVKKYPVTRPQNVPRRTKGRVFRLGVLHSKEMTEAMLLRNRRGFVNSQVNTVAHAPSIYHWLFHRCGVPFEETQELANSGGLTVNGKTVDRSGLESQMEWVELQKLDIRIRVEASTADRTSGFTIDNNSKSTNNDGRKGDSNGLPAVMWVPALKRALHRQYFFVYLQPGISITSDQTDPRSFVHRLTPLVGSVAGIGMNILRPIGFMNGMKGFGLATNDVSMVRYWNNEFLGNFGVYDVRFARGVPSEVLRRLAEEVQQLLNDGIRKQLSKDVIVPCECTLEPTSAYKKQHHKHKGDFVAGLYSKPLHDERLIIRSPLLPYRVARKIRRAGGFITMVRSGPFSLPPSLPQTKQRPLLPQELALMFTFERKLKTNRVVLSLREFEADNDLDGIEPEVILPSA